MSETDGSREPGSSRHDEDGLVRHVGAGEDRVVGGVPLFDLRGLNCPLPALKVGKRMRSMSPGECIWVETTDPLAVIDIPAFAAEHGHEVVQSHGVEGGHRFLIRNGGAQDGPSAS